MVKIRRSIQTSKENAIKINPLTREEQQMRTRKEANIINQEKDRRYSVPLYNNN
jgi:hypothetical protein